MLDCSIRYTIWTERYHIRFKSRSCDYSGITAIKWVCLVNICTFWAWGKGGVSMLSHVTAIKVWTNQAVTAQNYCKCCMLHEEKGNQNVKLFAGKNTSFLNVYFCLFLERYLFELHILKKIKMTPSGTEAISNPVLSRWTFFLKFYEKNNKQ